MYLRDCCCYLLLGSCAYISAGLLLLPFAGQLRICICGTAAATSFWAAAYIYLRDCCCYLLPGSCAYVSAEPLLLPLAGQIRICICGPANAGQLRVCICGTAAATFCRAAVHMYLRNRCYCLLLGRFAYVFVVLLMLASCTYVSVGLLPLPFAGQLRICICGTAAAIFM
jgi:hypothetical protein